MILRMMYDDIYSPKMAGMVASVPNEERLPGRDDSMTSAEGRGASSL